MLGISLAGWVLVDRLLKRRAFRERRARAHLRRILYLITPVPPYRRRTRIRDRQLP
jgi:hypothetical protein